MISSHAQKWCGVNSESDTPYLNILRENFPFGAVEAKHKSNVLPSLYPLSRFYSDLEGRILRLWKYNGNLIASIVCPDGRTQVLSGKKIHNALLPSEIDTVLLGRIEQAGLRTWQLAYFETSRDLYVWPHLIAEGKDKTPEETLHSLSEIRKHLAEKDKPGKTHVDLAAKELKDGSGKYDHVTEVRGFHQCCSKAIFSTNRELNRLQRHLANIEVQNNKQLKAKVVDQIKFVLAVQQNAKDLLVSLKRRDFSLTRLPIEIKEKQDRQKPGPIDALVFMVKKQAEEKAAKKPPEGGGNGGDGGRYIPVKHGPTQSNRLDAKSFKEMVQQNRLAASYNASHPDSQIVQKGSAGGTIGGIGNEVGIIKGLFESLSSFEESRHIFFVRTADGKKPCCDEELQQIMRELAVGIFVHDTIPFFSLHFNQDGNLYPVMHPAYHNTRVGEVISITDYYMKGFLNGVVYPRSFLDEWQRNRTQDPATLRKNAIDLHEYCKSALPECRIEYRSLKELLQFYELEDKMQLEEERAKGKAIEEPVLFSDYSGFRSSFRIIAKQNSFKKSGEVFEIDAGFDVFYTIEPDAVYEIELEKFRAQYGKDPSGYKRLTKAYEKMKHLIEELMPRLPLFHTLFEELKLINFLCYYFKTLQKAQKIPVLGPIYPQRPVAAAAAAPEEPPLKRAETETAASSTLPSQATRYYQPVTTIPLFPHLPMRLLQQEFIQIEFSSKALPREIFDALLSFVQSTPPNTFPPEPLLMSLLSHVDATLAKKAKFRVEKSDSDIKRRKNFIIEFLNAAKTEASFFVEKFIREKLPEIEEEIATITKSLAPLEEISLKFFLNIAEGEEDLKKVERDPSRYVNSPWTIREAIRKQRKNTKNLKRY